MFYTKAVTVKMLPFDNKPEFNVVIDLPEGTALPVTANLTWRLAQVLRTVPEVTALQTYAGAVSPFNFNGMVRHYYLRGKSWHADVQVMLMDKDERERSSHQIAEAARELLTPIAREGEARIAVVEMPPGPPVLQTVVAEVYGPDDRTRRRVAEDMTSHFEQVADLVDVDNYMAAPTERWHFAVDTEKAVRRQVSVETILRNIAMAMGGHRLGDVKRGKRAGARAHRHPGAAADPLGDRPARRPADPNRRRPQRAASGARSFKPIAEDPIVFRRTCGRWSTWWARWPGGWVRPSTGCWAWRRSWPIARPRTALS